MRKSLLLLVAASCLWGCSETQHVYPLHHRYGVVDAKAPLPAVPREFRAAWVATVGNIDWPSKPGLTTEAQQAELRAILDKCVALHLNAVVFQVRSVCDALYASALEPWAAVLSGTQGTPPDPPYDPLAFAIAEAHARGLELHAWFNPFRAGQSRHAETAFAANHISHTHSDWVRPYGKDIWLDPGVPEARDYVLNVFRDVIRRYDVDGVHVDDYFYPYPVSEKKSGPVEFPDDASWELYRSGGGKLARADWRRDNINRFMQAFYRLAHAEKPDLKVGISPFGIWRPGNPEQIKGFDAYEGLFADARLWWQQGWLDYLSPQLYWAIDPPAQSYPVLLRWWAGENTQRRHLWPGNFIGKVADKQSNWPAAEIVNQIRVTRSEPGAGGNVFFSMKALMRNRGGLCEALAEVYPTPALVPATPWLDDRIPPPPKVALGSNLNPNWMPLRISTRDAGVKRWVVQARYGPKWDLRIIGANSDGVEVAVAMDGVPIDLLAVRAVDRCGNVSVPVVLR